MFRSKSYLLVFQSAAIGLLALVASAVAVSPFLGPQQLDRSGWRIISETRQLADEDASVASRHNSLEYLDPSKIITTSTTTSTTEKPSGRRQPTSVDWDEESDDNELNQPTRDLTYLMALGQDNRNKFNSRLERFNLHASNKFAAPSKRKVSHPSKFHRLVFHGQLMNDRSPNVTRLVDGLKMNIHTHRPVAISRPLASRSNNRLDADSFQERSTASGGWLSSDADPEGWPSNAKVQAAESSQSSDWRPITSTRSRRNEKLAETAPRVANRSSSSGDNSSSAPSPADNKWKPLSLAKPSLDGVSSAKVASAKASKKNKQLESIIYGKKPAENPREIVVSSSSLEEPFDNDDQLVTLRSTSLVAHENTSLASSGDTKTVGLMKLFPTSSNGWLPIDTINATTTTTTTTTTPAPETTTSVGPSNSNSSSGLEAAQRSASDLNYIYSSQPQQAQPLTQQATSSYYNQYVIQPTQQSTFVDQPAAPLIDSTSGQVPEMVADRLPEAPIQLPMTDGYSAPQPSAQFQPVPAPPLVAASRPPSYPSAHDSYGGGSYASHGSARAQPSRQAPPQVVRQEHHYHYYNQQQPTRSQPQQQQQQPDGNLQQAERSVQTQQPTIIREIQPLIISQPAMTVSPPASSTPAPTQTIIREIVKEVPQQQQLPVQFQPVQVQRIIMAPPMLAPQPLRNADQFVEPAGLSLRDISAYSAPAARIMRTLTNSIPQVAVRMPQLAPLRFPMALPVRLGAAAANPAPVTRQTGSFVIPPQPKQTTTYLTETQAVPTHTTIMQTTQFTPATKTTVYTTEHQPQTVAASELRAAYRRRR